MNLGVFGLGNGGNRIVDTLLSQEFKKGTTVIRKAIAIDAAKSDLMGLEHIPESQQVTVGFSQVRGHGTGADVEVGSEIIQDDEQEITSVIHDPLIDDVDAYLVVTCAGGGMAGGASKLVELLQVIGTNPVYVAIVLPHMDEKGIHVLNAAINFNNIYKGADNLLVFDNENFYTEEVDDFQLREANEAISERILGLFSSVGGNSQNGASTISQDELDKIIAEHGISTIGYATKEVDIGSQSVVPKFIGGEADIDPDEAAKSLVSLTKTALDDIDIIALHEHVRFSILLISGPEGYLNSNAVSAAEQALSHDDQSGITVGTKTTGNSSKIKIVVVQAGISKAPALKSFKQIYDEAYNGPSSGAPKQPFFIYDQPTEPGGAHDDTTGSSQSSDEGTADAAKKSGPETGGTEISRSSVPDPSDIQGVDRPPKRTFEDVIGLSDVKNRIKEDVLIPARDERFEKYNVGSVTGVLFHGPPGTGKTYLAKATAGELGYNYIEVDPSEIKSQYVGGGAENVSELFERAKKAQPALIFIDEIDSIAGNRSGGDSMTQSERSMINQLLGELSELNESDDDLIVIAATNTLDEVDTAIKRAGRFDTTVHIGAPDFETRDGILRLTLEDGPPNELDEIDPDVIRSKTDGLVSSDLAEIGKSSIRKALADSKPDTTPVVETDHILRSIEEVVSKQQQDQSVAEMIEESPETDFDDVAGMSDLKHDLRQSIIEPAREPDRYEDYGLNITNGVLLHGPPGTGKTYLSKAVAGELNFNFINITASDIVSKWIGEGTQNVNKLFETALDNQPSVLFIDEIDAIASQRGGDARMHQDQEQIVNEILTGMTDVQDQDVVVLAATNLLSSLDDALTRAGRFDETIEVPPPDDEARMEILRFHLTERPLATDEIDWKEIKTLSRTDANGHRYVASDIKLIAETAARLALNQESPITQEHLRLAIEETEASFSAYD